MYKEIATIFLKQFFKSNNRLEIYGNLQSIVTGNSDYIKLFTQALFLRMIMIKIGEIIIK